MKYALVVDDSAVIRRIIRRMLENLEFRVVEAEDAMAAMRACDDSMPDVILLDWNMPEISGLEFLKDLRQRPGGAEPKVIFCTTENQVTKIQNAIECGADEYIMKPFNEFIIKEKLEQIGMII